MNGSRAPATMPLRPGEHACCRFADERDRRRVVVGFIRGGLVTAQKVIYICDAVRSASVCEQLSELDPAVEPAIVSGQLSVRPARSVYPSGERLDAEETVVSLRGERSRALRDGYAGLRVTGEMSWALARPSGGDELADFERALTREADGDGLLLLCQYDQTKFGAGTLAEIAEAHTIDIAPELVALGRFGGLAVAWDRVHSALRFTGELDFASAQAVTDTLDAHFRGPLSLDLGDLRYVDLAGMRALRGRTSQPLTIRGCSPEVRRLVAFMAWDADPAVELLE